jgi:hypothetical protein
MILKYFLLGIIFAFALVFLAKLFERKRGDKKDEN